MFKSPSKNPPRGEFIALMAMMMATNAFSIDAMLPALTEMGEQLSPDAPVRIQLVVLIFMIGMGFGVFFTGPLSDSFGRRKIMIISGGIYMIGAFLAWMAPSLELLLAARFIQGIGASGARVISMAMVRDRFSGRAMAQVTSMIITVFMLVPAIAPSIGAGIIWIGDWRAIFFSFLVFSMAVQTWFIFRQPETLPVENRRPVRLPMMAHAIKEIASISMVRRTVLALSCMFGMMMTTISSTEMVYEQTMGRGEQFPLWFGGAAIFALIAPIINSRIVVRFGMHRISTIVVTGQVLSSGVYLLALETGLIQADAVIWYFLWQVTVFMTISMTMGNLNALVMEPLGHVAGLGASFVAAISTLIGAVIAIPAAAAFDGTQIPLVMSVFAFTIFARLMLSGRAFESKAPQVV